MAEVLQDSNGIDPEKAKRRAELDQRLATVLAPMLLTLAVFMLIAANGKPAILDAVLSLVALGSVLTSAFLIDYLLDAEKMQFPERLGYLGYGYPVFCAVVGAMATVIPLLYHARRLPNLQLFVWTCGYEWFVALGLAVWLKLMTEKDSWYIIAAIAVIMVFIGGFLYCH